MTALIMLDLALGGVALVLFSLLALRELTDWIWLRWLK